MKLDDLPQMPWGKADEPVIKPLLLARGTLETIDMAKTRALGEVLGFTCKSLSADYMIMRHRSDRSGGNYWVLEVRTVDKVRSPQHLTNHWGLWVPTRADVDNAYDMLAAHKDELGLLRVQSPRKTHENARDYSFYFEDESRNWWEIGEQPNEAELMDSWLRLNNGASGAETPQ